MRATSASDDDPRQALHRLLREWVLSLQSRDTWEGTYAELASELHAVRATTRIDLSGLRFIPQSSDSLAAVLADAAAMFTRSGWSVAIGDETVLFSRSA